jgi:hypothetical protein
MSLLYRPVGLLVSVLGGVVAGAVFRQVWMRVSDEPDPPHPTDRSYGWKEVLAAAAIEGAIFGLVRAAIDRAGARGYQRLTGVWPGEG